MNLQKVCVSFLGGERSRTKNSCKTPRLLRQEKELWCTHRPVTHVNKSLAIVFPIHFVHFSLIVTKISKLPELRFVLVISNPCKNCPIYFVTTFLLILTKKAHLPQFRIFWRFLLEWWFTVLANLQKIIFVQFLWETGQERKFHQKHRNFHDRKKVMGQTAPMLSKHMVRGDSSV